MRRETRKRTSTLARDPADPSSESTTVSCRPTRRTVTAASTSVSRGRETNGATAAGAPNRGGRRPRAGDREQQGIEETGCRGFLPCLGWARGPVARRVQRKAGGAHATARPARGGGEGDLRRREPLTPGLVRERGAWPGQRLDGLGGGREPFRQGRHGITKDHGRPRGIVLRRRGFPGYWFCLAGSVDYLKVWGCW